MGIGGRVDRFEKDDGFLRRTDKKRHIKRGIVHWEAFRGRKNEQTLSFTFRDDSLQSSASLNEYQQYNKLPSGDLPGICTLTFYDLTEGLEPPLPPRRVEEKDDPKYGHLHCCTDLPTTEKQMYRMAQLATGHQSTICELVPKRKRT